jgi:hypothetical protein
METPTPSYPPLAVFLGFLCFGLLVVGPFIWLFYILTIQRTKKFVEDLTEFATRNGLTIEPNPLNASSPISGHYQKRPLQMGYNHNLGRKTFTITLQTNAKAGHYFHILSGSFQHNIEGIGITPEARVRANDKQFDTQFRCYGRPPETLHALITDRKFRQTINRFSWRARGKSVQLTLENQTLTYAEIDPMFNLIELSQMQRVLDWVSTVADTLEKKGTT